MVFNYDFEIAQLRIRFSSPYELKQLFELAPFSVPYDPSRPPDARYALEILPKDWIIKGEKLAQGPRSAVYKWNDELHRYFYWNVYSDQRFILVKSPENTQTEHTIYLQEDTLHRVLPQFRLSAFFAPEQLLMNHQAFLLHAAVVDWQGKGILFTGPSGIGKSTQAQLWSDLENAQIINGDRGIIRCHSHGIKVWGSPYAGTSQVYKNQGVPIHAIVVLSQGRENTLRRLAGVTAFQSVLKEATALPWDQQFISDLADLILDVTNRIPIYHLTCTPTSDAVEVLKKELHA